MRRINPKKEILPRELEELKAQLWKIPHIDRTCILVASIIEHEREALACASGLISVAASMAQGYSDSNKLRIAEILRSTADILDHKLEKSYEHVPQRN